MYLLCHKGIPIVIGACGCHEIQSSFWYVMSGKCWRHVWDSAPGASPGSGACLEQCGIWCWFQRTFYNQEYLLITEFWQWFSQVMKDIPSGAAVRDLQKRQDEERRDSTVSFNKRVSKFHHYLMLFSGRLMVFVEHTVLWGRFLTGVNWYRSMAVSVRLITC